VARKVVLMISSSNSNMGHLSKFRSNSPNMEKCCLYTWGYCLSQIFLEIFHKRLWWFQGQVRIWVTWGQKLCHTVQIWKNVVNIIGATVPLQISWKWTRKVVLMISRWSLRMDHLLSIASSQSPTMDKRC
jgi:hypothetical protein